MLDDRGHASDLISTLFDASDVERLIAENIGEPELPTWLPTQLHKFEVGSNERVLEQETLLKSPSNLVAHETSPIDFAADFEEFAQQFGLNALTEPNFLEDISDKPISTSTGIVDQGCAGKPASIVEIVAKQTAECWQPFSESDAVLDSVLTATVSNSDQLLSFLEEKGINSSPVARHRLMVEQLPSTPSSSAFRMTPRAAFSSPSTGVNTLSFSIKAGRIVSSGRIEEEKLGIFRTPSSKRRLDFLNTTPTLEDENKIKRTKGPSRLTIGRADEGILLMKENIDPTGPASPAAHATISRSPFAEVNGSSISIRSCSSSLGTQLYGTEYKDSTHIERIYSNDMLLENDGKEESEEDLVDAEYRKFVRNTLSLTSEKNDEEDDDDDEIYDATVSDLVHIKRMPPPSVHTGYRIKERELNGLIADCHQIISAESINSPFQKVEFQRPTETLRPSEIGISKEATRLERLVYRISSLIQAHVQLLFQQFILCATLASEYEEVSLMTKTIYSMLAELRMEGERSLTTLGRLLLPDAGGGVSYNLTCLLKTITAQKSTKESNLHNSTTIPSSRHVLTSVFMVPGLERLALLRPALDKLGLVTISPQMHFALGATSREGPRDLPPAMQILFVLLGPTMLERWKCLPFKSGKCPFLG